MNKKIDKFLEKVPTVVLVVIFLVLAVPTIVYSVNSISTGYRINAGTTSFPVVVDTPYDGCWNIKNSDGAKDFFIPTKSQSEWNALKAAYNPNDLYRCEVPNTECRLWYQYRIDNKTGELRSTPWTNNTDTYVTGPYSITKTGKDDTCNSSPGCGIRVGVQCQGDYGVNVTYEMLFEGVSGGVRSTGYPTLGGGISWGGWSERIYETGDSECSSPGCQIRMSIANNYSGNQTVTCGVGYQHRDQQSTSGWRYNNTLATVISSGSEGENCEGSGCGMQMALYCKGPVQGVGAPDAGSVGTNDGQCGSANGNIYDGGVSGLGESPPSSERCAAGTTSDYQYNPSSAATPGYWSWTCNGTNNGQNDYCVAFNAQDNWNPFVPGESNPGEEGCSGEDSSGGQSFTADPDSFGC